MAQYRVGHKPQCIPHTPNALRDLNIAARNEILADTVCEQWAFEPTTFGQRRPAHDHARADQVGDFACCFAKLLLGEAEPKALEEVRWRFDPIKNDAPSYPSCLRVCTNGL